MRERADNKVGLRQERNIESKTNRNKGKGLGDESLYYAVVNYCKKNPLHSTVEAAEFIYERQLD